jgi:hypothetical protein
MRAKLRLALKEAAYDDMGIYPAGTSYPDDRKEERTEWQNGWNAALIALSAKESQLEKWFSEIPERYQGCVEELLVDDVLRIDVRGDDINLYLLMNDTFEYACSDCEDVTFDDIDLIYSLWERFQHDGLTAWVAKKRGYEPIEPCRTSTYRVAMNVLNSR